jgi:Protein of unknown function (DUF2959)
MPRRSWLACLSLCAFLAARQSAYYKTMKTFGKEKRDILVKRVIDSKKDQEQTKEKLQTTLESFQQLTGFQGGSLDQVSNDLFKEWQSEIDQMSNSNLKSKALPCFAIPSSGRLPT